MDIQVQTQPDGILVAAVTSGEKLDMSTAGDLKKAMAPLLTDGARIVLDLSSVNFVDSSGLGAILSCLRDVSGRGGDLRLCGVQKRVRVLFELVRMHRIVGIYNTVDEALAAYRDSTAPASS